MFLVIKKRTVIILTAVLLVAIIAVALTSSVLVADGAKASRLVPIYSVDTEEAKVAISFDASWGADKTRAIMDILDQYGYKATFFLTGIWIDEYPELVKEIHNRGHLIGNHSNNHKHLSELSVEKLRDEIDQTAEKIKALTGEYPAYYRAPFGEYDNTLIKELEARSVQCIQWSIDSLDWKGISAGNISDNILKKLEKGAIILCHNNSDHIVEALPLVFMTIKNKGLTAVRLDEMVYKSGYSIDASGKQIKNQ